MDVLDDHHLHDHKPIWLINQIAICHKFHPTCNGSLINMSANLKLTKLAPRGLRTEQCVRRALIMANAICYGNVREAHDIFHFYRLT